MKCLEAVQFAGVPELAEAADAGDVVDIQIRRAAERVNGLLQDRLGLRGALLGEQDGTVVLREAVARRRGNAAAKNSDNARCGLGSGGIMR